MSKPRALLFFVATLTGVSLLAASPVPTYSASTGTQFLDDCRAAAAATTDQVVEPIKQQRRGVVASLFVEATLQQDSGRDYAAELMAIDRQIENTFNFVLADLNQDCWTSYDTLEEELRIAENLTKTGIEHFDNLSQAAGSGIAQGAVTPAVLKGYTEVSEDAEASIQLKLTAVKTAQTQVAAQKSTSPQNAPTNVSTAALAKAYIAQLAVSDSLQSIANPMFFDPYASKPSLRFSTINPALKTEAEDSQANFTPIPANFLAAATAANPAPAPSIVTTSAPASSPTPAARAEYSGGGIGGIVSCLGVDDCDLCSLGQMMQNIINFLIALSIPIAAAMFAFAGFLFATGGANPTQLGRARSIFKNVMIGFLITISSWLVVQTLLSAVFDKDFWIGGNWNELKCISQSTSNPGGGGRLIGTNFGDLINTIVPQPPPPTINVISGTSYSCSIGTYSPQTNSCVDASGKIIGAPSATQVQSIPVGTGTRGYAQCPQGNPHCSTSILRAQGLSLAQANAASCIAFSENAGLAAGCSGTGPCGAFQISQTNWKAYAPAGCAAADFGGNIARAQNDGQCNMKTAVIMMGELGYQPWTGNHPGLPPWNPAARTCVSNYDPANL